MSELAMLGGPKTRHEPYPQWPVWDQRDVDAVTEVVKSGRWGGHPYPGPQTVRLAKNFAELQGGGYAVPMINGTVTMEVALRAAGIGWGDEVIIPAYTFQATAAAPMAAGAIPVIANIDPDTYCISPRAIESALTRRTRAILPVHLGHQMADMDAILVIAERYHLIVVEDCAHAHGSKWNGKGAGTLGHFGSFSLQSSKILTSGEGGILLCRTPELAAKAASIIDCGRAHALGGGEEIDGETTMGTNYRMSELQAALANVGLERFPAQQNQREQLIAYMDEALSEVTGVRVLKRDPRHTTRSFYRYIFAIDTQVFGVEHDIACAALSAEGINCGTGYEAMHHYSLFHPERSHLAVPNAFPEYFRFEQMSFPEAERAGEHEAIWLDEAIFRSDAHGVDDVVEALKKIQRNADELSEATKKLKGESA
jgi:dTDP-4-amino-4,6-dideoxygalactose transaminase